MALHVSLRLACSTLSLHKMDLLIRFIPLIIFIFIGDAWSQRLYQVHMEEVPPVRSGSVGRFRCSYVGENVTIQYVSWTKIGSDARRIFVYEYSEQPPMSKAYHDFVGRAVVKSGDNLADRYRRGEVAYTKNNQVNDLNQYVGEQARVIGSGPLVDPRKADQTEDGLIAQIQRNMLKASGIPQSLASPEDLLRFNDAPLNSNLKNDLDMKEDESIIESVYGPDKESVKTETVVAERSYIPVYQASPDSINNTQEAVTMATPADYQTRSAGFYMPTSDDHAFEALMRYFSPTHLRRQRRSVPIGHIDLYLSNVRLEDEARYECTVKPVGGPALSNSMLLSIQVAPSEPVIENLPEEPLVEGQNITLSCGCNVGKPAGRLAWSLMRKGDATFSEVPDNLVETSSSTLPNSTTSAVSQLRVTVAEEDDGAVYRCTASSDIMGAYEARPFTQTTLSLQYPPRGGRILFDTAVGRYYCHARGKPAPTYAWIWIQPDGRQTIMSTNRYLDLRGMRQSGYYRFHCLASNIIKGVRHTKVMATKLRVIAPEAPVTTPLPPTTTTEKQTTESTTKEPDIPKFISRYGRYDAHETMPDHHKQYVAPEAEKALEDPTPTYPYQTTPQVRTYAPTIIPRLPAHSKSQGLRYTEDDKDDVDKRPSGAGFYDENLREGRLYQDKDYSDDVTTTASADTKSYDDYHKSQPTKPTHKDDNNIHYNDKPEKKKKKEKEKDYYYYYYNTDDDKYSRYNYDGDNAKKDEPEGRQGYLPEERPHERDAKQSREEEEEQEERDPAAYANEHEMVSRSSHSEYNCKERSDGVYGAGCRAFFRCLNKLGYFVECKKPYVYNRRAGKCDKPDLAPAPCGIWKDCSNKKSKKYADVEYDCRNYYTCWHGFFMGHNECNPGLVFNEKVQLCDWPENVPSPCGKGQSKRRKSRRSRSTAVLTG